MADSWIPAVKQRLLAASSKEYLLWGFGLFIIGYFFMPSASSHAKLYYVMVLIPLAYNWQTVLELYRSNSVLKCLLVFCCYMFLSTFWSEHIDFTGVRFALGHTFVTLCFPVAVVLAYKWYPQKFDSIFKVAVAFAAVFSIISMAIIYWDAPFPKTRLVYIGRMDSPTKASSAYAFFGLLACYFATLNVTGRARAIYASMGVIIVSALLFSQARGAIGAFSVGLIILLSRSYIKFFVALGLLVALFFLLNPDYWETWIMNRGWSYRPDIWQYTIDKVGDSWLLGKGFLSTTGTTLAGKWAEEHGHAHSQILATYRDGGIIAIVLLFLLWGGALWQAGKLYIKGESLLFALLVCGFLCLIPYQDRLITRPREHWLYFWLPVSLVVAYFYAGQRRLGETLEIKSSKH
jgi:hypothetical protein